MRFARRGKYFDEKNRVKYSILLIVGKPGWAANHHNVWIRIQTRMRHSQANVGRRHDATTSPRSRQQAGDHVANDDPVHLRAPRHGPHVPVVILALELSRA